MKRFKRFLATLVAVGALGGGSMAVVAPSAMAGNCTTITASDVFYDGQWTQQARLANCTGVTGAKIFGFGNGLTGLFWRQGTGGRFFETSTGTTTWALSQGSYAANYSVPVFGPGCGAPPIVVAFQFAFSIRSGTTWGPTHVALFHNQAIC